MPATRGQLLAQHVAGARAVAGEVLAGQAERLGEQLHPRTAGQPEHRLAAAARDRVAERDERRSSRAAARPPRSPRAGGRRARAVSCPGAQPPAPLPALSGPGGSCAPRSRGRARPGPARCTARAGELLRQADEAPLDFVVREPADRLGGECPPLARAGSPTSRAAVSLSCVPGVDDLPLDAGAPASAACRARQGRTRTAAPPCRGGPSSSRRRTTGGVMTPRSSAISGRSPSSRRAARRTARARVRAASARRARRRRPSGTAQAATNPRKWSIRATSKSSNVRRRRSTHQR